MHNRKLTVSFRKTGSVFLALLALAVAGGAAGCSGVAGAPNSDPVPPSTPPSLVISGVAASNITTTSATIAWATNVPGTSQVDFGTTTNYGSSTQLDPTLVTSHSQTLSGLLSDTLYHYRVRSKDANDAETASGDFTFTTASDATPPTISNVSATPGSTSAVITWATDQPATSQVEYGSTASLGFSTPLDSTMLTTHLVDVAGLIPQSLYHYRVRSSNANGMEAVSDSFTFTTTSDTTPPGISNVTASTGSTSAAISWTTTEPADSQVEYGETSSYGNTTPLDASMVTSHAASVSGLTPTTAYHYRVLSRDAAGNLATSGDFTFVTDGTVGQATVSIQGTQFFLNGSVTNPGTSVEGLLLNSRMVQAAFDDENPNTVGNWAYPDTGVWDPERNTNEFLAAVPFYANHGLQAVTVNLQGGNPLTSAGTDNQEWIVTAYNMDGTLKQAWLDRLDKVIGTCSDNGIVVILGFFYFGQDHRLADEPAILQATDNVTDWLLNQGYTNVLVEINNEADVRYNHAILQPARVHELIGRVQNRSGGKLKVSTSFGGGTIPPDSVISQSDFILVHGNGQTSTGIQSMVDQIRAKSSYQAAPKPILFNEDSTSLTNMDAAIARGASWGYHDKGQSNYVDGFQAPPVNWTINTTAKQDFFNHVASLTGSNTGGPSSGLGWQALPNTKIRSVCPPNTAEYSFSSKCKGVVIAWSGGTVDSTRNRLLVWGGGHGDYFGNELYALDLDDLTITRLTDPSPINPTPDQCVEKLSGGAPNSRHTYDGIAYLAHADRVFAYGGSLACNPGNASSLTWILNPGSLTWTDMQPSGTNPSPRLGVVTAYDPNSQKVFLHDTQHLYNYTFETNTYQRIRSDVPIDIHMTAVVDPKRQKLIIVGGGWKTSGGIRYVDISAGSSHQLQTPPTTGDKTAEGAASPGLAYDPTLDRIVAYAGGGTVYLLNVDTWEWTPVTHSGGAGPTPSSGTFGRWGYVPNMKLFVVINSVDDTGYVLRLSTN